MFYKNLTSKAGTFPEYFRGNENLILSKDRIAEDIFRK